ncbi:hypothetical protein BB559_002060 [Furculomyces boomerangus]|uniref:C3H1-type domain-containing protein n=2 Tax=Harpellales TaxID=61421 RepID=A0A2T9YYD3_9FUNG|nr:hypothetical protein BB559_002060 [Furculomyces boomerangus]PWA02167.1 hypothetical protein BB558_001697 [Smittium angustum]
MTSPNTTGLILFKVAFNKPTEYLLFSDSYSNNRHWSPPKGKRLGDEDEQRSALRNTIEITGMSAKEVDVISDFRATIQYISKNDIKKAVFFLGRIIDNSAAVKTFTDSGGIVFSWNKLDKAIEKLVFPSIQSIFTKAEEYISELKDYWIKPYPPKTLTNFQSNRIPQNSTDRKGYTNSPATQDHNGYDKNIKRNRNITYPNKSSSSYPNNSYPPQTNETTSRFVKEQTPSQSNWRRKSPIENNYEQPEPNPQNPPIEKSTSSRWKIDDRKDSNENKSWRIRDYEGDWADEDLDFDWAPQNTESTSNIIPKPQSIPISSGPVSKTFSSSSHTSESRRNSYSRNQSAWRRNEDNNNTTYNQDRYQSSTDRRNYDSRRQQSYNQNDSYQRQESSSIHQPRRENSLYKTKLCEKFEQSGDCPYESRCVFAHGIAELRTRPVSDTDTFSSRKDTNQQSRPNTNYDPVESNPLYKTSLCDRFERFGECPRGDQCNYAHGQLELRKRPQTTNRSYNNSSSNYGETSNQSRLQTSEIRSFQKLSLNSSSRYNEAPYLGPRKPDGNIQWANQPSFNKTLSKNDRFDSSNEYESPKASLSSTQHETTPAPTKPNTSNDLQKTGLYIPAHRKNNPDNFQSSSYQNRSYNNEFSGKQRVVKVINPPNENRISRNDVTPVAKELKQSGYIDINHDNSFDSGHMRAKTKQLENETIKTFNIYFYGSENSTELIKRPLNDELKEVTRIEFRHNLTKKQLLVALLCGIFSPFKGRIPKSFVQDRIKLIKKFVTPSDQKYILHGLVSLYSIGETLNVHSEQNKQANALAGSVLNNTNDIEEKKNLTVSPNVTGEKSKTKSVWSGAISNLLMTFYNADIIEEDIFLDWYNANSIDPIEPAIVSMKTFADWLKTAEEE